MVKIIITEAALVQGSVTCRATVEYKVSGDVDGIEVSAMWKSVRNGGLERDVKGALEKLCAKHGLNAGELLR